MSVCMRHCNKKGWHVLDSLFHSVSVQIPGRFFSGRTMTRSNFRHHTSSPEEASQRALEPADVGKSSLDPSRKAGEAFESRRSGSGTHLNDVDVLHEIHGGSSKQVSNINNILMVEACEDSHLSKSPLAVRLVLEGRDFLDGDAFPGDGIPRRSEISLHMRIAALKHDNDIPIYFPELGGETRYRVARIGPGHITGNIRR